LVVLAAAVCTARPASAQQDPPAPPNALTLSGSAVYIDQYSVACDKAHPAANAATNPFANINPLVCHGQSFPADSAGHCSLKGMTVIKQVGNTCYYCAPVNPPLLDGIIIPIDDTQQASLQGFTCGVDQQDPDCMVVCSRQYGSGPYLPAQGTILMGPPGTQPQFPVTVPVNTQTPLQAAADANPCSPNIDQSTPAKQAAAAQQIAADAAACNAQRCQHNPELDVCKTLPAQASASQKPPPQTPAKTTPPANPLTNSLDYIRGLVDGFGGCIKSFGDLVAGASAFAQGDFVNAARLWGLTPGQSVALKLIASELTTPVVGQNVSAYDQGVTAGRRICSYGVVPGVVKAAGTALKGGIPAAAAKPLTGTQVLDATSGENPASLAGQTIETAQGPVQLGDYVGNGQFGAVFKLPGGKVIKISNNKVGSAESFPRQITGSQRLGQIKVATPEIDVTKSQPATPTQPGTIVMDDVSQKWPGSKQYSSFKQVSGLPEYNQVVAAITKLTNEISEGGYIWPDSHFGNMAFVADGAGGLNAIVIDADMIMTVGEMQSAIASNGFPALVLKEVLSGIGQEGAMSQPFTAQSMMNLVRAARIGGGLPDGSTVPGP
jgi:hypothetical protein